MDLVRAQSRTIQFCFSPFYSEEFSLRKFQYRLLRHLYKGFHVLTYMYIALWGVCLQVQNVLRNTIPEMKMEFYVLLVRTWEFGLYIQIIG
jgi:hypothetical protein